MVGDACISVCVGDTPGNGLFLTYHLVLPQDKFVIDNLATGFSLAALPIGHYEGFCLLYKQVTGVMGVVLPDMPHPANLARTVQKKGEMMLSLRSSYLQAVNPHLYKFEKSRMLSGASALLGWHCLAVPGPKDSLTGAFDQRMQHSVLRGSWGEAVYSGCKMTDDGLDFFYTAYGEEITFFLFHAAFAGKGEA